MAGGVNNQFMPDQEMDTDPGPALGVVLEQAGGLMFRQYGKSEEGMQHSETLMRKERTKPITVPAVYHNDIRAQLLALAPAGTYGKTSRVIIR